MHQERMGIAAAAELVQKRSGESQTCTKNGWKVELGEGAPMALAEVANFLVSPFWAVGLEPEEGRV